MLDADGRPRPGHSSGGNAAARPDLAGKRAVRPENCAISSRCDPGSCPRVCFHVPLLFSPSRSIAPSASCSGPSTAPTCGSRVIRAAACCGSDPKFDQTIRRPTAKSGPLRGWAGKLRDFVPLRPRILSPFCFHSYLRGRAEKHHDFRTLQPWILSPCPFSLLAARASGQSPDTATPSLTDHERVQYTLARLYGGRAVKNKGLIWIMKGGRRFLHRDAKVSVPPARISESAQYRFGDTPIGKHCDRCLAVALYRDGFNSIVRRISAKQCSCDVLCKGRNGSNAFFAQLSRHGLRPENQLWAVRGPNKYTVRATIEKLPGRSRALADGQGEVPTVPRSIRAH